MASGLRVASGGELAPESSGHPFLGAAMAALDVACESARAKEMARLVDAIAPLRAEVQRVWERDGDRVEADQLIQRSVRLAEILALAGAPGRQAGAAPRRSARLTLIGGGSRTHRMRSLLLTLLLTAAACGHAPVAPMAFAADTPMLVTNPPPRSLYRYVGRVQGVARPSDFVEATRVAKDDLRWKAHALGADVVRIDFVAAAPTHGPTRPMVLLAGRAYRAISHQ